MEHERKPVPLVWHIAMWRPCRAKYACLSTAKGCDKASIFENKSTAFENTEWKYKACYVVMMVKVDARPDIDVQDDATEGIPWRVFMERLKVRVNLEFLVLFRKMILNLVIWL